MPLALMRRRAPLPLLDERIINQGIHEGVSAEGKDSTVDTNALVVRQHNCARKFHCAPAVRLLHAEGLDNGRNATYQGKSAHDPGRGQRRYPEVAEQQNPQGNAQYA